MYSEKELQQAVREERDRCASKAEEIANGWRNAALSSDYKEQGRNDAGASIAAAHFIAAAIRHGD